MSDGVHRRSYTTADGVAEAVPWRSTLHIQQELYKNKRDTLSFQYFGWPEEMVHGRHILTGHVRNMRLLELNSIDTLRGLINGQINVSLAKLQIIQNELAAEQIHTKSEVFVETVDQFTALESLKEFEAEERAADRDIAAVGRLGEEQVAARPIVDRVLYSKLERLQDKFGTWLVPHFAGYLTLNLPIFAPDSTPSERTQAAADVDFNARFETIYQTLLDQIEPDPRLDMYGKRGLDDTLRTALDTFVSDLLDALTIETVHPQDQSVTLPLLDLPIETDSTEFDPFRDVQQIDPPDRPLFIDAFTAFTTFGCVIVHTTDTRPDLYVPNYHVSGKLVGTTSTLRKLYDTFLNPVIDYFNLGVSYPGPYVSYHYTADRRTGTRTYLQELFETHVACGVIEQLLDQSLTDAHALNPELLCPFCGAHHHPYKAKCIDVAVPDEEARAWANATAWEDYFVKTAPFVKPFAATVVPGEAELTMYRHDRRQEAD